jgi:flagellar biosynthesis protein FlhF
MRTSTFTGSDLRHAFAVAREALGDDVVIVKTNITRANGVRRVELTVALADEVDRLRDQVMVPPPAPRAASGARPTVIALVGPTGAGKTTSAAKLALSAAGFAGKRIGLLTIDTYRIGAVEQMAQIAELAQLPLAVAYEAGDVRRSLQRFAGCDVVIVDTPGRGPRTRDVNDRAKALLRAARPDEIHFAIPATTRPDIARHLRDRYADAAPTFALITKCDELLDRRELGELMLALEMPARWMGDGQDLANDLRDARGEFNFPPPSPGPRTSGLRLLGVAA